MLLTHWTGNRGRGGKGPDGVLLFLLYSLNGQWGDGKKEAKDVSSRHNNWPQGETAEGKLDSYAHLWTTVERVVRRSAA